LQHYDFYFFIINKTLGPGRKRLFDYSAESSSLLNQAADQSTAPRSSSGGLQTAASKAADSVTARNLEGAGDDPSFTKVVDRRWYERNKHIYPASAWQEFDPEKSYDEEIRRDLGGNAFFFSR
jgi:protein FAM50